MALSLLAFDTDRIKEYVFASSTLKEIRGASSILDRLNLEQLRGMVGGDCAYAHGGSGLFAVPSDQVDGIIEQVRRAYADASAGAASITGVAVELPADFDLAQSDVQPYWRLLSYRLAAKKARNPPVRAGMSHPLLRYADGDSDAPAALRDQGDDDALISVVSERKRARNRELRNAASSTGKAYPEDFETLAAGSQPNGYLALVVADGDSMGRALEACRTFAEIGTVAEQIYAILEDSREAALAAAKLSEQQYDVLLRGGDDLIVMMQAQHALDFTVSLCEEFRRRTQETFNTAYTLSAGVVWAPMRFPFGVWRELGENTLAFAKRSAAERGIAGGLINFLVVSSANHLSFAEFYNDVLTSSDDELQQRIVRTMRPYTPAQLRRLSEYRASDDLLRRLPRSKLEALNQAVFQPNSRRALLDAMKVLVHWRGQQTLAAVQRLVPDIRGDSPRQVMFPFVVERETAADRDDEVDVYRTPLADLAELWDFIPGGADAA